jgi:hypothetical protein
MILPTKRLSPDRALLAVGAEILTLLDEPKTVSRLWEETRLTRARRAHSAAVTYDWFVLALDLLYLLSAIDLERGRIRRAHT